MKSLIILGVFTFFWLVIGIPSIGFGYKYSAFNPEYPFNYEVPPVINLILDHPFINKSKVTWNSPYAGIPRKTIGNYSYHNASVCGTHFLNPGEGYILNDEIGDGELDDENSTITSLYCTWSFVGDNFCTPSLNCPKFIANLKKSDSDCRQNYLQVSDREGGIGSHQFAFHFCNESQLPSDDEFTTNGGVLDVTFRYAEKVTRPSFQCFVKCVPYKVNFTTSQTEKNQTVIKVHQTLYPYSQNQHRQNSVPKSQISTECQCGISNPLRSKLESPLDSGENRNSRILGGREAIIGVYPWMVALVHKDRHLPFCGGSLINDRYVLTAQHCLDDESFEDFEVVLNEHDFLNESETSSIRRNISKFIKYNHYLPSVFDGDMALLLLESPVNISNPSTTPICLPTNLTNTYVGYDVIGAGWGTLNETSEKSPKLLEVGLRVISNAACNDYHHSQPPSPLQVSERMLCSGFPEGGRDTCSGDSGGPLVTFDNGRFTQIGVTSWGFGCGNPLNPGVFCRVTEFIDWIQMNTLDGVYCS